MTTAFIMCGALGREVLEIIQKYEWDAKVIGVSAMDHMFPERIAPDVEERIERYREQYERLIVVFGDCGSRGALDQLLQRYHDIERIAGPHCYEMYGGKLFHQLMAEEPGSFFLTDFLVRGFRGTVMKGLGLDRFPQLKEEYFRHYKRIVYLVQNSSPELRQKAEAIADYLKLPLEIRETGYGLLEERLVELMAKEPPASTLPKTKEEVASLSEALNGNEPAEASTSHHVRWHERKEAPSSRRRERKFKRGAKE